MNIRLFAVVIVALGLGACARLTSIERTQNLPETPGTDGTGTILLVDAKQRAIYTVSREPPDGKGGIINKKIPIYCAEPSPDAMTAIAANSGLNLSQKDAATVALNAGLAEQTSDIGLRTQTIQLMRDIMFRECEAYVNGADNDIAFTTAHRRLQSSMVAIAAIEQLTGAVKASQPSLTPSLSQTGGGAQQDQKNSQQNNSGQQQNQGGTGQQASQSGNDKSKNGKKQGQTTAGNQEGDAAAQGGNTKVKQSGGAQQNQGNQQADPSKTKQQQATKNNQGGSKQNQQNAGAKQQQGGGDQTQPTGGSDKTGGMAQVADSVYKIVHETLNLQFSREMCTSVLAARTGDDFSNATLAHTVAGQCFVYLTQSVQADVDAAQAHAASCRDLLSKASEAIGKAGANAKDVAEAEAKFLDSVDCKQAPQPLLSPAQ